MYETRGYPIDVALRERRRRERADWRVRRAAQLRAILIALRPQITNAPVR